MNDYIPERDDYLNWEDDWNKSRTIWDDGTHTSYNESKNYISKYWYKNGLLHRDDDKPAVIEYQEIEWYKNGKFYRENDKPHRISVKGVRNWLISDPLNHLLHRDYDRPAVINGFNGYKMWYKKGKQYFPIENIQKSILFNPTKQLVELFIENIEKQLISQLFIPEFQKQLLNKNPSLVNLIPKEILVSEYEGLKILGDVRL